MLENLKKNTFEKHDAFTVGEVFNMKKDELGEFIGENGHFSSMFDFSAQCLSFGGHGWYDAPDFTFKQYRNAIFNAQKESENVGFLSNIIENHDEPRGASRYLPEPVSYTHLFNFCNSCLHEYAIYKCQGNNR